MVNVLALYQTNLSSFNDSSVVFSTTVALPGMGGAGEETWSTLLPEGKRKAAEGAMAV